MMNNTINSAKSFFLKCKRVWYVMKKPTNREFSMIAKISAIGVLVIGFFGFLVSITIKLIAG